MLSFWTVVLEKTLESPLDSKEIQPVYPKGNQSWIFIGRTEAEAETPILWPPDAKNWLIWKDPYAGKDWGREEKGTTEDEMVGWHHRLNGRVWIRSGSWWWTGKPGMLQSMGSQKSRIQLSHWTEPLSSGFQLKIFEGKFDLQWNAASCHSTSLHKYIHLCNPKSSGVVELYN